MTHLLRKTIALLVLFALLTPMAAIPPVAAQTGLDGSRCWQPGQLSISGAEMSWSVPPATIIQPGMAYRASLQTTAGSIQIALDPVNAPIATNNFICLALAGYYTGTDFHRIAANLLIQGGDPSGTGSGGPGYTVPSDPTMGAYPAGAVAMANVAPNQNGSQFFVAASDLTGLIPATYPVFGQVTSGLDVVTAISQGAVQANAAGEQSKPVDPTILLSVTISESPGVPVTATTAGPPLTTPPATTAPVTTPMTQPTPTPNPGDAQARPGGSSSAGAPTPATTPGGTTTESPGCTGLTAYQNAFDDAYMAAAFANPDALAFLMALQQSDSAQNMFQQMTPEQATAMSAFYAALAGAIEQIVPPPFAAEWHQVQIEVFRALSEFTANIASQGLTIASIQASPKLQELSTRDSAALASASAICGDFRAWATGETPAT